MGRWECDLEGGEVHGRRACVVGGVCERCGCMGGEVFGCVWRVGVVGVVVFWPCG